MPGPLPSEVQERLRVTVIEQVLPRFGDNPKRAQSAAAKALDVDPSTINRLVNGRGGGSYDLVSSVSRLLNDPEEKILKGEAGGSPVRKLREIEGFADAILEARRRVLEEHSGLSALALERAADARVVPEPPRVTAGLIIQMAVVFQVEGNPQGQRPRKRKVTPKR